MKIAVIKIGARIAFGANDKSGASGEARSIIGMLHEGGAEVEVFTKILSKDTLVDWVVWNQISDVANPDYDYSRFDALFVINGQIPFYAGAEDYESLLGYKMLNEFPGKVFYIYCDPELKLSQVWNTVEKKEWASKWKETDLNITRTDINYLSQPYDTQKVIDSLGKNKVIPEKIIHFPFEQFPLMNGYRDFNPNPVVDLSYGGTFRKGKREKKMVKFYFGHPEEISVEMFGKLSIDDFKPELVTGLRPPEFAPPVLYDKMLSKMNESLAHLVIGDPLYEKINDIPQRLYESVSAGVVTFIDTDMDRERRVWGTDTSLSWLYVSSREELSEKILQLKNNPHFRKDLIDLQRAVVNFDPTKYSQSLINIVKQEITS